MKIESGNICFPGTNCVPWEWFVVYLTIAVAVLVAVLGVLLWDARRTPTPSQAAARANRHATLASVVGVALMVAILTWVIGGVALSLTPWDGRVVAALPALAGASLLTAQAVGQLTWPRPSGMRRHAELARRTVENLTPRGSRHIVLALAGTALALLVTFGLVADGPRSLTREAGRYTEAIGPYPGSYYGVPLAAAILVLLVATELTLRLITVRPAVVGVTTEWDLQLRSRSATHVTRGVQVVLAVTNAGILAVAARAHRTLGGNWIHLASGGYASEGSVDQQRLGDALFLAAGCVLLAGLASTVLPLRRAAQEPRGAVGLTVAP